MRLTMASEAWPAHKLFIMALTVLFAGCANLSTIDRTTQLPHHGLAIHLDAAQRVVLSDKDGFVCAEPSPDALQAYVSAIGASVADPASKAASLSAAFNTNASSIGLRTQSITLMRETLYRLCEAARNKSLTSVDVAQLLQRSQDLTLAVLAIEQLTGAVVARQVSMSGSSNATASANVANTQAVLDGAKKSEQIAKDALTAAQSEERRQTDALQKADQELAAAKQKEPLDQPAVDKLTAQQAEQSGKVQRAKDDVKVANDAFVNAQKAVQVIQANFNAALSSAQAAASGTGTFSTGTDRSTIDQHTVEHIAVATTSIIDSVITKGRLTDACITLMNQYAATSNSMGQGNWKELEKHCALVFKTYMDAYKCTYTDCGKPGNKSPPSPPQPLFTSKAKNADVPAKHRVNPPAPEQASPPVAPVPVPAPAKPKRFIAPPPPPAPMTPG